ncbi:MAG: sensor histidine kinase [Desulfobacterales bacterium]
MDREKIKIDLLIHDLKVPLAIVESGITLLLEKPEKYGPLTAKQKKVLIRTLRNTKVTQTLVNDALELGKSREGIVNLTSFSLSNLFEETLIELFDLVDINTSERIKTCTELSELKEILSENGLALIIDEGLWSQDVCLDEAKIKQILRNLLNNALKYRKSIVEIKVDKKDDHLFLSVKDDGEGIPSVFHKKIFESYFQLEAKNGAPIRGSGLGLAGVLILVEDLGGKLFLESEEGEGADFSLELPLPKKT